MDVKKEWDKIKQEKADMEIMEYHGLLKTILFSSYRAKGLSCEEAWDAGIKDLEWLFDNNKLFDTPDQTADGDLG